MKFTKMAAEIIIDSTRQQTSAEILRQWGAVIDRGISLLQNPNSVLSGIVPKDEQVPEGFVKVPEGFVKYQVNGIDVLCRKTVEKPVPAMVPTNESHIIMEKNPDQQGFMNFVMPLIARAGRILADTFRFPGPPALVTEA